MASAVVMPRLGWTMETGQLVEWRKGDGDAVEAGEVLFSVESDKAVSDVEALESGVLRVPSDSPAAGVEVPVGSVLAYLVQPGELAPFERAPGPVGAPASDRAAAVAPPGEAIVTPASLPRSGPDEPAASPRARRVAAELRVDWTALRGSGRTGRIVERDVRAAAGTRPPLAPPTPPRVTPLARRVAAEAGIDPEQLAAGGRGQRVTRADVEAVAPAASAATPAPAVPATPISGVRRIIAARLAESAHTAAPVTLTTEADATELVRIRGQLAADLAGTGEPVPSYVDLLIRLTALGLLEHPALNASIVEDRIVEHAAVHIGLAVDSERGLLVPVVRDAQAKSVQRIAAESARLIAETRAGKAAPDDLRGGTFTITNLGMHDIDAFTPIINLPECAILGVGRIVARPVVIDEAAETVAVRKMMALSLTFDHRVVDGAPAARFLQRVKQSVERPFSWLTR